MVLVEADCLATKLRPGRRSGKATAMAAREANALLRQARFIMSRYDFAADITAALSAPVGAKRWPRSGSGIKTVPGGDVLLTSHSAKGLNRQPDDSSRLACETWPLRILIQHIVEHHHTCLRTQLPEIGPLIRQTISRQGHTRSGQFIEIEKLFRQFQRENENHLQK